MKTRDLNTPVPIMTEKIFKRIVSVQFLCTVILSLVLFSHFLGLSIVPSLSMYPTLSVGESLVVQKTNNFSYGDIVTFHPPTQDSKLTYVKRVIGLPGDIIEVKNGLLYRNNIPLNDIHTAEPTINYSLDAFTVPSESYWLMGDNRNNSGDSHVFGPVPFENCIGKVVIHFNFLSGFLQAPTEAP